MKKHCEVKHSNILKMYVNEIAQQHFVEIDASRKQSSKLQKVVLSISTIFNNITTYKNQMKILKFSLMILC